MAQGKKRQRGKQVSRETMAQARYAQKHGLISSRAKLSGNKVSAKVLDRVTNLGRLNALPMYEPNERTGKLNVTAQPERVGAKLPKGRRRDQHAAGFQIINGLAIVPRADARFIAAISGRPGTPTAGVRALPDAVDAGYMNVIQLDSGGIRNFRDLFRALRGGKLQGLKRPEEQWAFTVFNGVPDKSMDKVYHFSGRITGIRTDAELLAYLERYQFIVDAVRDPEDEEGQEQFDAFELMVVPPGERAPPMTEDTRERLKKVRQRMAREKRKARPKDYLVLEKAREMKQAAYAASEKLHRETSRKNMVVYRQRLREEMGDDAYKADEASKRKARRKAMKNRAD